MRVITRVISYFEEKCTRPERRHGKNAVFWIIPVYDRWWLWAQKPSLLFLYFLDLVIEAVFVFVF